LQTTRFLQLFMIKNGISVLEKFYFSKTGFATVISLIMLLFLSACATTELTDTDKKKNDKSLVKYYPVNENEKILNEKGEEILITDDDPDFFKKPSKDHLEYFRAIISSDSYRVIQIRGSDKLKRVADPGGDALMMEEIPKYDLVDYTDDGIIQVKLSSYTGKIEGVNFHTRSMRITDLSKVVQNDATRWNIQHSTQGEPAITQFRITYQVVLRNKANPSREDVIKKVKKR
jgi:hypothetical protein